MFLFPVYKDLSSPFFQWNIGIKKWGQKDWVRLALGFDLYAGESGHFQNERLKTDNFCPKACCLYVGNAFPVYFRHAESAHHAIKPLKTICTERNNNRKHWERSSASHTETEEERTLRFFSKMKQDAFYESAPPPGICGINQK